jgi:hypothetical protein
MKTRKANSEDNDCASELRSNISGIFDLCHSNQIVLTPGILVGLNILLGGLSVNNISLSRYEYYDEHHFPNSQTGSFDVENVIEHICQCSPDMAIVSLVTWRGKSLPLNNVFRQIRTAFGKDAPLLIADCAHAGAIGFPSMDEIEADIICGDICKWITPSEWQRNLAFLWFRDRLLWEKAAQTFRPYYLAIPQERTHLLARWIDPYEVKTVVSWLRETRLDRNRLLQRHQHNMDLARKLSGQLGLSDPPESSILWIDDESKSTILLDELEQSELAWRPPNGGLRILCRAEEQPALRLIANLNHEHVDDLLDPPVGCL